MFEMFMPVCVCVYVSMYAWILTCIHETIVFYACVCVYVCVCVCVCVCVLSECASFVLVSVCVSVCV